MCFLPFRVVCKFMRQGGEGRGKGERVKMGRELCGVRGCGFGKREGAWWREMQDHDKAETMLPVLSYLGSGKLSCQLTAC
jgi:hypothetical protein